MDAVVRAHNSERLSAAAAALHDALHTALICTWQLGKQLPVAVACQQAARGAQQLNLPQQCLPCCVQTRLKSLQP